MLAEDGCWAVVGHNDGLDVYYVFREELSALRKLNDEGYMGLKVIWLPWGMSPQDAENEWNHRD